MEHNNLKVGRIMIVDDEAELMTALCEAVAEQGYEAKGFTAGAEALKVLVEQDYDLLLTDLMMPEMDGIALLKAGLEIDPNLVCIIMTGQGTVQTAVEAMKKGAFDYILKPFKLNTIMPALSRAMEVRSLRMDNIQLKETVAIHELGKAIAFSTDLNAIMNKVADAVLQQCASDEVSIMLPTREGKELYVAIARGGHSEYIGERVTMERSIAGWVASNRETVIINGKVDDPRFSPVNPRSDLRAAVSMPMMSGGSLVGVLNVNFTKSHRHITLGQVKALSILVSIISPILENTWLNIKMREAEEKYRSIFNNATEGIYQSTPEGWFITANKEMAIMLGYDSPEELISNVTDMASQIYANPEDRTKIRQLVENDGQAKSFETRFYRKDGSAVWVSMSTSAVRDKNGNILNYDGIVKDINDRKLAEEELKESEELFKSYLENAPDGIYMSDLEGNFLYGNRKCEEIIGYRREELIGKNFLELNLLSENSLDKAAKLLQANIEGKPTGPDELILINKKGLLIPVEINTSVVQQKGQGIVLAFVRDITDRKQSEDWLLRERNMVDRIMKTSPAGIMVVDRKGQIVFANKRAEEIFCLTKNEITQLVYSVSELHITDFDGSPFHEEQLPFALVMNTGNPVYGIRHVIELPDRQRVFLSINSAPIFDESVHISEVVLTIDDITEYRQAEEKIQQGIKQLEKSLGDTIKAMSMVVETRDPYTAGHQEKVARLAAAIAKKMGLSEEIIKGIQMAGVIHDIGKMNIPADILSKPGKLSSIEMQLIRIHPQAGYDIMKDVEFPWPVARIILEHHERMDGSGYPRNLKGDDILIEARILAVADVVEAMASHRPYRPGLGIEAALNEIEKNRGTHYDNTVADTCLKLFREKGFQLEGA